MTPTNDFQTHLHVNSDVIGRPPDLAQPDTSGSVTRRYRPLSTVPLGVHFEIKVASLSVQSLGVTEMARLEWPLKATHPPGTYVAADWLKTSDIAKYAKTSFIRLRTLAVNNLSKNVSAMETAVKVQNVPWPPVDADSNRRKCSGFFTERYDCGSDTRPSTPHSCRPDSCGCVICRFVFRLQMALGLNTNQSVSFRPSRLLTNHRHLLNENLKLLFR